VESNDGCGEVAVRDVVVVVIARQAASGPYMVFFSLGRVKCDVAVVSWRPVLHGGNFLGAVVSASFDTYRCLVTPEVSMTSRVWTVGRCCGSGFSFVAVVEWSGGSIV